MPSFFHFLRSATWRMIPSAIGVADFYNNNSSSITTQHNSSEFHNLNLNESKKSHICHHQFSSEYKNNFKFEKQSKSHLAENLNSLSRRDNSFLNKLQETKLASFIQTSFPSAEVASTNYSPPRPSTSTLSLHISKYEADIEAETSGESLSGDTNINKHAFSLSDSSKQLLNDLFEFPRQEENKEAATPEIQQFQASQKLFNPNAISPPPSQSRPWVSPFRKYIPEPAQVIHNLKTANSQLETQIDEKQTLIEQLLRENQMLKNEKEQKEQDLSKENRMLQTRIKVLEKERLSFKSERDELKSEISRQKKNFKQNEKRRSASQDKKPFDDYTDDGKRRIVNRVWEELVDRWGDDTAKYIIDKLNHQKNEKEAKMLSPLETLHVIKRSQMTFNSFKIMIHELKTLGIKNNIFSSYYSVLKERQRITQNFKTEIKKVKMRANADSPLTDVDVIFLQELEHNFQQKVDETCNAGNYKPRYYRGQEEIWWCLMADKGKDISKLVAVYGNTKRPINSPFNLLYLLMYAMDDSQFNIEAAFKLVSSGLKGITHLIVTENGIQRRVPVRFFFNGDYKIQKGAGGIRSGRCKNPCVKCISPEDTTFEKFNMNAPLTSREIKIDKAICQDHLPVFDWIPYSHYIPPPLHSTMAFAGYFFELIFDIAMTIDAKNSEFESVANVLKSNQLKIWKKRHESLAELKEEVHAIQDYINCFEEFEQRQPSEYLESCGSPSCISTIVGANVPFEPTEQCDKCNELFHECCMWYKKCPVCTSTRPTQDQSLSKIQKEKSLVLADLKKMEHKIEAEEKEIKKFISENKLGPVAQEVEKVLEKNGGTKKAFFQAYTGGQLTTMASKIDDITTALPAELTENERYQHIVTAMKFFYQIKLLMMGESLSDERIGRIDEKMQQFVEHLKTNLSDLKVKHKGHYWILHAPEFIHEFGFGSMFNEEVVENGHKVINIYDRRIKTRDIEKRLQYLMKCTREDNVIFDRVNFE